MPYKIIQKYFYEWNLTAVRTDLQRINITILYTSEIYGIEHINIVVMKM